ncbi:MAG: ABC transporter substrate-binding protein [Gammaproteobacteria bacterium]|nr:ABC transporter substrate-binding protein [Gammaproteobacteria bacterium]
MSNKEHRYIPKLKEQLAEGKINRREFLRYSTLLGLSATLAYNFAEKATGVGFIRSAQAQEIPKGGTLRWAMRCPEIKNPHVYQWVYDSNIARPVVEYLTRTDTDNVTYPYLAEKWEASDDLKTWTFNVRQGIKWHNGRDFTADDVVWNLQHVLDPATGSSVVGLMKGYIMEEYDTGEKNEDGSAKMANKLWDASAIEIVDDHTVRLNLKAAQVAVPEHLFHYPLLILDPEEGGEFGPGSNGTGPFELAEYKVGEKAVLKARAESWGDKPYLDAIEYIDLGDDPAAAVSAIASGQVKGMYDADVNQLDVFKNLPGVTISSATTASTGVFRVQTDRPEFKDPKARQALRYAVGNKRIAELALRELGTPAENHHVCPVHPDYAELPFPERDIEKAKQLAAESGLDKVEIAIACKKDPAWELAAVQAMVEQMKEAGLNATINLMPSAQFWDNWDKVPVGFTSWAHRPLGFMVLGLAYRTGVPWNESHYSNPEFDELLTKAEGTLDVEERREIIKQLEQIMQEDGPIVQPSWRAVFTPVHEKVKGFEQHPTQYIFPERLGVEA